MTELIILISASILFGVLITSFIAGARISTQRSRINKLKCEIKEVREAIDDVSYHKGKEYVHSTKRASLAALSKLYEMENKLVELNEEMRVIARQSGATDQELETAYPYQTSENEGLVCVC